MKTCLLGVDIGTSSVKATLFDTEGTALESSTKTYNLYYPHHAYVEQDPKEWWESTCAAIKECLKNSGICGNDIAAVGIAGQSWSAIPMDKYGEVICNTPIWMDTRAKAICERVNSQIGNERIFNVAKNPFKPMYSTPKIIWFKENKPEVYKKADFFLQSNSYIAYKMTGKISQDKSQCYGLHFYDMGKGVYDETLADELKVDLSKFPEISECHDVVGEIMKNAAAATGLAVGTPVVAGGLDAACGTLGAGVFRDGQTQEQGGQAGGMSICESEAIGHEKLILSNHVVSGKWLLQGGTVGGGGAMNWFNRELGFFEQIQGKKEDISSFEVLSREAGEVSLGAEGLIFLPYMSGERSPIWDENAKGVFFGLDYSKKRKHMVRALMEGVAFSLRHNVETARQAGADIESFNAMGGSANSKVWTQIKADVTGIPVNVAKSDTATTWGAAVIAGLGVGIYKDIGDAMEGRVEIKRTHEPDINKHSKYTEYYELYIEIYDKLKSTMEKLSNKEL